MTMQSLDRLTVEELRRQVETLKWYHTLDLGDGIVTPGFYDHRPYLKYYGIPQDLAGKTALDVGAASGFFSFEMEKRGAQVTAVDLPAWFDHDFGPRYQPDQTAGQGLQYLREPIMLAKQALGSKISKVEKTIYDLAPETDGTYDMVFCGSLLLHLTDPTRALWRLQSVTRGLAIIATAIYNSPTNDPVALFTGYHRGDVWWLPSRMCLEKMVQSAGFSDWKWFSEFRLDYRDGTPGFYHGVIHAWNGSFPDFADIKMYQDQIEPNQPPFDERDAEIARLRTLVDGYERGRFIGLMKWLKNKGILSRKE